MDSYKDRWEGSSTVKRCGAVTGVDIAAFATDMKTSWLPEGVDEEVDVEANALFLSPQVACYPFANC
ncbi:hypothetical protein [Rhizobium sp. 007]|uniref:hypothetical protein n=1 Tax=Rhizobium sp. 007 TaxID=2785056 RepID=UPI00188E9943|nr:hypothetical protein [Rhizobium sp. 007]QPB22703.1 hypothetical protein ISN39_24300 [Rhizobium sp. 007]